MSRDSALSRGGLLRGRGRELDGELTQAGGEASNSARVTKLNYLISSGGRYTRKRDSGEILNVYTNFSLPLLRNLPETTSTTDTASGVSFT